MSFNDYSEGFTPPEFDGAVTVEVIGIEPAKSEFGDRNKFRLKVWDQNGELVTLDNGQPYEWWQYTSKAIGPKSKAGPWIAALLNRPLTEGDRGPEIARELIGKRATGVAVKQPDSEYRDLAGVQAVMALDVEEVEVPARTF